VVRILISGDSVCPGGAARIAAAALGMGFAVRYLPDVALPEAANLSDLNVPLSVILGEDAKQEYWAWRLARLSEVTHVSKVADLTEITVEDLLRAHPEDECWDFELAIINFMFDQGLSFADVPDLKEWLGWELQGFGLLGTSIANRLLQEGHRWLRTVTFLSEYDLLRMRGIGMRSLGRITAVLEEFGMHLN